MLSLIAKGIAHFAPQNYKKNPIYASISDKKCYFFKFSYLFVRIICWSRLFVHMLFFRPP